MRTTVELKPEHRAKLLELAARRGEKGYSSVIAEALDAYLGAGAEAERLRNRCLRLRGVLSKEAADRLRRESRTLRGSWR